MGTQAAPIIATVGQQVRMLEARPFRPFKTSEEYLYAMKEDLAEWLHSLYEVDINVDNFLEQLETGVLLCQHANRVHRLASDGGQGHLVGHVVYRHTVGPGTFPARDNVSNFIKWCRQLGIYECLLFETEDLVTRKNEKSFILCLLEVARRGAKLGMPAPLLVQMEQEIDRDIERDNAGSGGHLSLAEMRNGPQDVPDGDRPQIIRNDLKSLDEMVRDLVNRCVCPEQFLMVREAEGKYRIGETKMLIYVRILRSHVMVRVGGGWDTLEHFLDKHDPCRCRQVHRQITGSKVTIKHGQNGPGQTQMQVTYERSPLAPSVQSVQNRQQSLSPMSGSPPRMRKASSSSNSSNQPSSTGSQTSLNAEKVCAEETTANNDSELQRNHRPRLTVTTPPEDKDLLHTDGHRTVKGTKPAGSPKMENGRRLDPSPRRCKVQHVGCSPNCVPCQCSNSNVSKKSLASSAPRSPSMDNLSKQQQQQHGVSSPSMSRRSRRLSQDHGHNASMSPAASSATRSQRPVLNRSLSSGTTELCAFTRDGAGRFSARERRVSSSPVPPGRSTWNSSCNAQVPRSRPFLRPDTYRPPQSQSHSGSYNSSPTKSPLSTAQMLAEQIREKNLSCKEVEELIRKLEEEREALVRRDRGRGRDQAGCLNKRDTSRTASPSSRSTVRSSPATVVTVTASPVGPIGDGQCYTKQWLANNANNGQRKRRSSLASPSSPDSGSDLGCEASPMVPCGSGSGCDEPDGPVGPRGPEGQGEDSNMSSESSSSVVIRVSPRKDLQPAASASKIPVPLFY